MLKGLGDIANLGSVLKQAQEMGSKLEKINEELRHKRVTGQAGGGLVEVEANGLGDVQSVRIDESLFEARDREMVEDLLPAAIRAAQEKARELHKESMRALTGGIELPGMADMLGKLSGDQGPSNE